MTQSEGYGGHILVVDDDARIRQMLYRYFEDEGYRVSLAANGAEMRAAMAGGQPEVDVVLLDLMLAGGEDGLTLARDLRRQSNVAIIMLTGRGEVVDRIVGLEVGADDYIAKPFHLREVLARLKSVLRRRQPVQPVPVAAEPVPAGRVSRFDGWSLDFDRRQLLAASGDEVTLTTGEFDLLAAFIKNPGRVLDRNTLMDLTKGRNWEVFDRSIDAQIARLRKKIEADPKQPQVIKSVRGVGYVFASKIDR